MPQARNQKEDRMRHDYQVDPALGIEEVAEVELD